MKISKINFFLFLFCFFLISCEKDITVDLPKGEDKLVVEGWIEQGSPAFVILTKSAPYFDKTDLASFQNSFVKGATVIVSDGVLNDTLLEFCSNDYTDAELMQLAPFIGISYETLRSVNYCLFTYNYHAAPVIIGEVGKNYTLKIFWNGSVYTSITQIPYLVPLDSAWFKVEPEEKELGLGYMHAHITDPDSVGNNYNWKAKRLGKDESFLEPLGASVDDRLINGKSFEFGYDRHREENSDKPDEKEPYQGFFQVGDTVVIKWSSIDKAHYEFLLTYESSILSAGNPFASPSTIKTNIIGNALGVWGGFGVTYDTVYAK